MARKRSFRPCFALVIPVGLGAFLWTPVSRARGTTADWPAYGRDPGATRYSPLRQINQANVNQLKVAWIYHTGDVSDCKKLPTPSAFEATPIMVEGTLYLPTPFDRVIALDPETGKERWTYDPKLDVSRHHAGRLVARGVATWLDPLSIRSATCYS
jgi:quinoprotein glucose dehydrogenase